jgi:hypothetical protein
MFTNTFYALHEAVAELIAEMRWADVRSIHESVGLELINEPMWELIEEYSMVDLSMHPTELALAGGELQYKFPQSKEKSFLDCDWFAHNLFEYFKIEQMVKLLSAALLEKSIIFVGEPT